MLVTVRPALRAFAATVTPEMAALDDAAWLDVERVIEHALSRRPPKVQRQIVTLLCAIDMIARVRHGRAFAALRDVQRTALIGALERAPVALVRRGIWGLRTLVFMGYYTGESVTTEIGYGASARGWLMENRA